MKFKLHIWRQENATDAGRFVTYEVDGISPDMSFLEMLDVLNERLSVKGKDIVSFDSDCREGVCGMCSLVIDGSAHGPQKETTTCQLYMRHYKDGQEITIEPWRARPFPVVKDLVIDRSALDRIMQSGGYISVHSGPKPEPNASPIQPEVSELAMDAATCIGCGACVAACPNGSAMLYTAAKVSHLGLLPQGQPERNQRVLRMVGQMEKEGFGGCTNYGECQAACPKDISISFISRMNQDFLRATLCTPLDPRGSVKAQ